MSEVCAAPRDTPRVKDEASQLAAALMDVRLCLRCAAIKSDVPEERLVGLIQSVQRNLTITERIGECDSCRRRTLVYRLG